MTRSGYGSGGSSDSEESLSDRLPRAPGDRLLLGLLIILIVGVPTVFLRTAFTTFDVPQLTLLWVLAVAVALVGVYRVLVTGVVERGPLALTVASVTFLAALVFTSVLSDQPWVAFTGLTVRGAGAITYGLCLGLLHAVYRLGRRRSLQPIVLAFVGAHGLVVLYALVQAYGLDPFTWGAGNLYVGPVFSTLGNPNFSAGYVGLTLPLLVWVAFGSRLPVVLRVVGGAGIGASSVALAYLNSFQGDVAALLAVGVLCHWVLVRSRIGRVVAVMIALPVVAVIGGTPLLSSTPRIEFLIGGMAVLSASAAIAAWWDRQHPVTDADESGAVALGLRWRYVTVALITTGAATAFMGGRILDELGSGLVQRVEFWKVSLSVFLSSPLVGTGLETYPAYFTSHRSIGHAVSWETVLSDSPHSVPLGLLSGGGLVLGLAYVAVMTVVLWAGVMAIRQTGGPEGQMYGAVLAAWVAYHVQSSVSMDMPGLIHAQWVLGGVLLAGGVASHPSGVRDAHRSRRVRVLRSQHASSWMANAVSVLLVVSMLLLLVPLTAPLRADLAGYRAQQALDRTDLQTAGDELLAAIDMQPRNGFYAAGMAVVYANSGLLDLAFDELERSARLQPGQPSVALAVARTAVRLNRPGIAEQWFETALSYEPYGPRVVTESALFFVRIGNTERARGLLHDFEELDYPGSSHSGPWMMVEKAYRQLGEAILAERAAECWGAGGVQIPEAC